MARFRYASTNGAQVTLWWQYGNSLRSQLAHRNFGTLHSQLRTGGGANLSARCRISRPALYVGAKHVAANKLRIA